MVHKCSLDSGHRELGYKYDRNAWCYIYSVYKLNAKYLAYNKWVCPDARHCIFEIKHDWLHKTVYKHRATDPSKRPLSTPSRTDQRHARLRLYVFFCWRSAINLKSIIYFSSVRQTSSESVYGWFHLGKMWLAHLSCLRNLNELKFHSATFWETYAYKISIECTHCLFAISSFRRVLPRLLIGKICVLTIASFIAKHYSLLKMYELHLCKNICFYDLLSLV